MRLPETAVRTADLAQFDILSLLTCLYTTFPYYVTGLWHSTHLLSQLLAFKGNEKAQEEETGRSD